jgi:hypothetical protein
MLSLGYAHARSTRLLASLNVTVGGRWVLESPHSPTAHDRSDLLISCSPRLTCLGIETCRSPLRAADP